MDDKLQVDNLLLTNIKNRLPELENLSKYAAIRLGSASLSL